MIDISIEFIKAFCFMKGITLKSFYNSFGFDFTYSYFMQVMNKQKPITEKFKNQVNLCLSEYYKISNIEFITAMKIKELIK